MMKISHSPEYSEHWLTLMTCTICTNTPDNSPVYKCGLGHTICYPCFQKLVGAGMPVCRVCDSDKFTRHDVSKDFLKKLKVKPGIGRPCRYIDSSKNVMTKGVDYDEEPKKVTVEKLFQLSSSKLQRLFDERTKEKMRKWSSYPSNAIDNFPSKMLLCNDDSSVTKSLALRSSNTWLKMEPTLINKCTSSCYLQSRKPLKCPHDPCNKIIAVSSFQSHFKYEHFDFKRFSLERGKELGLMFNPSVLQHDRSLCLGIIKLYEMGGSIVKTGSKNNTVELDTFWVMVSGSPDHRPSHAYVIFWLFTNNDECYNCTLELSAQHDLMTCTTFCGVNGIQDSQHIWEIGERLNCLYLTHGTLESMLAYGPVLKLRVLIH